MLNVICAAVRYYIFESDTAGGGFPGIIPWCSAVTHHNDRDPRAGPYSVIKVVMFLLQSLSSQCNSSNVTRISFIVQVHMATKCLWGSMNSSDNQFKAVSESWDFSICETLFNRITLSNHDRFAFA